MAELGFASTTDEVLGDIDLSGKVALVTGASTGLGLETSRALASRGAQVVMLARNSEKLNAAAASLEELELPGQLDTALLDLADLRQVRSAAATLVNLYPRIDLLINNAGVMACPLSRTAQDFELQFGTNHLGHFLLTGLLAPSLLAAAAAGRAPRVVNLSSAGHRFAPVDFDDPNYRTREYNKWQAYGESKTANVLFTVGLDARLAPLGVRAFAVHPGMIFTELGRHLDEEDIQALGTRAEQAKVNGGGFKKIPQGAATSVWAATAASLAGEGGLYLEDCHIARPAAESDSGGVEAYAVDPAHAERLWQLSERLVETQFDFSKEAETP